MVVDKQTPPMPGTLSGPAVPIEGLMRIPIDEIEMGERLRPLDVDWVMRLGEIMLAEGQRMPVEVCKLPGRKSFTLVSGAHRLAAAQAFLDLSPIKAILVGPDALDRKLGEISENIWRKDLDPYDRAVFIAELVRTLKLKRGVDPNADGRSISAQVKWQDKLSDEAGDANANIAFTYGWAAEAAENLGFSKRTVYGALMIFSRIPAQMIATFRNRAHPILKNASELKAFAKLEEDEQKHVFGLLVHANKIHTGAPFAKVADALAASRGKGPHPVESERKYNKFTGQITSAWSRLSTAHKRRMIPEFAQHIPPGMRQEFRDAFDQLDAEDAADGYPQFLDTLKWQLASRAEFDRLKAANPETLTDLERAARFLYLQRMGFGGMPRHMGIDFNGGTRFNLTKLEPMLQDVHERLAPVVIERMPFADLIRKYDSRPGTLFYCDPPYFGCEDDYGKNIFSEVDFTVLRDLLAAIQGRFVLSINAVTEIRELFAGFDIEEVSLNYRVSGKPTPAKELIISN
ncbi:DNA adenine methylase [Parasphingorhabdus sp.]|uniref:DNA adenine methylase n=1 Tax=Parasphingorhabdus sp. TaxID=2709688 RepID=UPI003002C1DB